MTGRGGPNGPPGGSGSPAGGGEVAQSKGPSVGNERQAPEVDVQRLADKVYKLFLADLSNQKRRASGRKE